MWMGRVMDEAEKRKEIEAINAVGLRKLRAYCEGKKRPVKDFDRDIEIIKWSIRYGFSACVVRYNISRQCARDKLRRYSVYARRAAEWEGEER